MSRKDRTAEREVADFFHSTVRTPERIAAERAAKGPRWPRYKRNVKGFTAGYAAARLFRRIF